MFVLPLNICKTDLFQWLLSNKTCIIFIFCLIEIISTLIIIYYEKWQCWCLWEAFVTNGFFSLWCLKCLIKFYKHQFWKHKNQHIAVYLVCVYTFTQKYTCTHLCYQWYAKWVSHSIHGEKFFSPNPKLILSTSNYF